MSKSDSLKNGMRSGLDGLLSSTGKSTQKKEPEESTAVRLAKKLGKQNMGEKGRMEIMKHYTR